MLLNENGAYLLLSGFVAFLSVSFQFTQSEEDQAPLFKRLYASFVAFCLDCVLSWVLIYPADFKIIWVLLWSVGAGLFLAKVLKLALAQGENSRSLIEFIKTFGEVWSEIQERRKNI